MAVSFQVIGHLIEEETKAEGLIAEAQVEANKRITQARAQADEAYKAEYEKIITRLEETHAAQTETINKNYDSQIQEYRAKLLDTPLDTQAFNGLLKKLLAAR